MELVYRRATVDDLELLTETRIIVLRAANKLSDEVDVSEVKKQSYDYYKKALDEETHIAYLVFDNDEVVGTGGVSLVQVMPTFHNSTGKKAYIMNGKTII